MRHSLDAVVLELVRSHPHHACVLGSLAVVCRHDINVPFIVAGPGIKPNTVVTHLAANYDLAPTWLELAGITGSYNPSEFAYSAGIGAPAGAQNLGIAGGPPFDGKSLVPLLHGIQDRGKIWYRTCTHERAFINDERPRITSSDSADLPRWAQTLCKRVAPLKPTKRRSRRGPRRRI